MFADRLSEETAQAFAAGLRAVSANALIEESVSISDHRFLTLGHTRLPLMTTGLNSNPGLNRPPIPVSLNSHQVQWNLAQIDRIVVIGAGKASGELTRQLLNHLARYQPGLPPVAGWVNVADNDPGLDEPVRIFPARPVSENLPTPRVIEGTHQIIDQVDQLGPRDLCIAIISGGGSALLCAPSTGITLDDKRWVVQALSQRGASIEQINRVRQQLSQVKGGRLIGRRRSGGWVSLILSDILGDPLHMIASGPTIPQSDSPTQALAVLTELGFDADNTPARIWRALTTAPENQENADIKTQANLLPAYHCLLGNLETAVQGATSWLAKLGYLTATEIQQRSTESVDETCERWLHWLLERRSGDRPQALVRGGEPILKLDRPPGCGGRNLHLVLSLIDRLLKLPDSQFFRLPQFCFLSAGTDGEDGSAPVAGGWLNHRLLVELRQQRTDVSHYLDSYDAFSFFSRWQTVCDPTATLTNVGDLQLAMTAPHPAFSAVK